MFMYIWYGLLFLSHCGRPQPTIVDERLAPYVSEFAALAGPRASFPEGIEVVVDKAGPYCDQRGPLEWKVAMSPDFFTKYWYTPDFRRVAMFHELTHCALGHMSHSPDPTNYMYSTAPLMTKEKLYEQVQEYK